MPIASIQPLAGAKRGVGVDDQVNLLGRAGGKPGAGEVERRPRDLFQPQNLAVEPPRALQVRYPQTDVVYGFDLHADTAYRARPCYAETAAASAGSQR